jgi:hypothetical protein
VEGCVLNLSGSGFGSFVGSCEHGNETSGAINGGGAEISRSAK